MTHQNEDRPHLQSQSALRNVVSFLPAIVWTILLIVLSLMPGGSARRLFIIDMPIADKIGHGAFHAVLAILILHGYMRSGLSVRKGMMVAVGLSIVLGGLIEWLQEVYTTSRHFEVFDLMANIMGALCGCALFNLFLKKKYHGS